VRLEIGDAVTLLAESVRIRVRLTPKSSRDCIGGVETLADGSMVLSVRVRAVPENGQANEALEALLAKTAGVARTRVSVVSGATSRIKTVEIEGEPSAIVARLCATD
jgi:uncharacterized protein (TIGR00251 family)